MLFQLLILLGRFGRWVFDMGPSNSPRVVKWEQRREEKALARRRRQRREAAEGGNPGRHVSGAGM